MKDRSAYGGGSPEAPKMRTRARRRTRRGLSRPRRRPGGSNSLVGLGWGFSLSFVWRIWGKEIGSPGLTLSELRTGIGSKAEKWSCRLLSKYKTNNNTHPVQPSPLPKNGRRYYMPA